MLEQLQKNRGLFLFEGILFIILGCLAVALPGISTLGTELFIGWLIFFTGLIQGYRTIQSREAPGFLGSLLSSIMYVIFGLLLVIYPVAGIFSLTILVTFFFIFEGLSKIILGFQLREFKQWGWFILNGVLALVMAYIIWSGWPESAFWVIGLLVGINMIFFGLTLTYFSFSLPKNTP